MHTARKGVKAISSIFLVKFREKNTVHSRALVDVYTAVDD